MTTHDYLRKAGVNLRNFIIIAMRITDHEWSCNTTQVPDKVGYDAAEIITAIIEKSREQGFQPFVVCEVRGDYTAEELFELADNLQDHEGWDMYVTDETLFQEAMNDVQRDELAAKPPAGWLH